MSNNFAIFSAPIQIIDTADLQRQKLRLQISYGFYKTTFGHCLIATTAQGICNLYFLNDVTQDLAASAL
ncbi:MAG: hypothetical protein WBB82_00695, partial [Limnothrix sp.]